MGVWNNGIEGRNFDKKDESRIKKYNKHLPNWTNEDIIVSSYSIYSYVPRNRKFRRFKLDKRRIK